MTDVDTIAENYFIKTQDWHNDDNALYYDNLPSGTLQEFARLGGLDTFCDLELIRPQIMQANSILEVAAGYGRVLDGLIQMGYKKKIVAVERCKKFYPLLETYTEKSPDITAVHSDIRDFRTNEKFDLILWLWMGIEEFSLEEQYAVLSKLSHNLSFDGLLVLDTLLYSTIPKQAVWSSDHYSIIKGQHNTYMYLYALSNQQIGNYAILLKKQLRHINYLTATNRPRVLHLLY